MFALCDWNKPVKSAYRLLIIIDDFFLRAAAECG